jgi:hypothetical protein
MTTDPNSDKRYRRPRAWHRAKRDLGRCHGIGALMAMLEDGANPRFAMAVALHAYAAAGRRRRARMVRDYCKWMDHCRAAERAT